MKISFSPIRSDRSLKLSKLGDVLIVNDVPYDFTELPEGASLPRQAVTGDWLASDVMRVDRTVQLTVILPIGPAATPEMAFPEIIYVSEDGPVTIPTQTHTPVEELS